MNGKLTSSGDLFTALEDYQKKGFAAVALVFAKNNDTETELIFAGDGPPEARLAAINGLLRTDAHPAGFIGVTQSGNVQTWPLPNYRHNEKIKKYLESVGRECRKEMFLVSGLADEASQSLIVH